MCTSCVDRLFTSGPAPCPVAGCHVTLRKKGFHAAFFADLTIEREVDIRRRVGLVFNRQQSDFENLLAWNDYLQDVEDLVFDIVNGSAKEKKIAEDKLKAYEEVNKKEIADNRAQEKQYQENIRRQESSDMAAAKRRRDQAAKELLDEREAANRTKREMLDRLANDEGHAEEITRAAEKAIAKTQDKTRGDLPDLGTRPEFAIRGLKAKKIREIEKPYDPFGHLDLTPSRYVLQESYPNEWLAAAKNDINHMVGGYSFKEYYTRTMFEAFAGLTVFIEDTKSGETDQNQATSNGGSNATVSTPQLHDVF